MSVTECLEQARHNRHVADVLSQGSPVGLQWTVTCIFYAALHYVNAYLLHHGQRTPTNHGARDYSVRCHMSGFGEGRHALEATLLGQRLALGAGEPAVGAGLGAGFLERDEHDLALAVTVFEHGDATQVARDGSDQHPGHRLGAVGGKGFEGERSIPLPAPMCAHWGWPIVSDHEPAASRFVRRTEPSPELLAQPPYGAIGLFAWRYTLGP